jgi:hypothetical protein
MTLQIEAEERIGFVMRYGAALQRAREDAAYAALKGGL